jgi:hypothetical protein
MNMPNLEKLSAPKLLALIETLDAAHSALLEEVIAAGYGSYTGRQIRELVKVEPWPLLVEHLAADDALSLARFELDARRRYHGGDQPIRRRA